jgi:hypothetical protein
LEPLGRVRLGSCYQIKRSRHDGSRVSGGRRRAIRGLRRLRHPAAAGLTMVLTVLYVAGAVVITAYMLVALLRPDKF